MKMETFCIVCLYKVLAGLDGKTLYKTIFGIHQSNAYAHKALKNEQIAILFATNFSLFKKIRNTAVKCPSAVYLLHSLKLVLQFG